MSCADAFPDTDCDSSALPGFALEIWGLPTSQPTSDPVNPDFVYQRFERGIMHFSRATGTTQGLLVGDWLKRIIVGTDLSPDLDAVVLVGGQGTRLRPLTSRVPKPVIPLVDRPFACYMLEWLHEHDVDDVIMSCGFLAGGVRAVLGELQRPRGPERPRLLDVAES